jgi:NAD(P)H-dependent FMN reductase
VNPSIKHVLQFFKYDHLPANLQEVSKQFAELASSVAASADNPEVTVALRKLLEAKDAAVRAVLVKMIEAK